MTISAIPSTSATTTSAPPATSGALQGTTDQFLKLFLAQLQNQDPTSPASSTDMVAQLAQLSSVEQQTQTNTDLTQLIAAQSSTSSASLSNLVGRQCSANLGTINVTNMSQIPPIETSSGGAIAGASIVVTNSAGKQVRTIPIPAGGGAVAWDGKDSAGNTLPIGSYTLSVNTGTTTTAINATWQGRIDGVQLGATGSSLQMGGIQIQPSDMTTIGAVLAATGTAPTTTTTPTTPTTPTVSTIGTTPTTTTSVLQGAQS